MTSNENEEILDNGVNWSADDGDAPEEHQQFLNSGTAEDLPVLEEASVAEPVEKTQTDHLNKMLLSMFLNRLNETSVNVNPEEGENDENNFE